MAVFIDEGEGKQTMTLKELPIGKSATLTVVGGEGALRQHFLDMGLIPGAAVTCLQRSSSGDPIAYEICGAAVALRNRDAKMILVTPVS